MLAMVRAQRLGWMQQWRRRPGAWCEDGVQPGIVVTGVGGVVGFPMCALRGMGTRMEAHQQDQNRPQSRDASQ